MTGRFTIEANNPGPRDNTSLSAGFHPGRKGDHFWLRPSGESQAPHAAGRSNVPRLCSHQAGRAHAPLTAGRSDITISSPFFGNPLRWNGGGGVTSTRTKKVQHTLDKAHQQNSRLTSMRSVAETLTISSLRVQISRTSLYAQKVHVNIEFD